MHLTTLRDVEHPGSDGSAPVAGTDLIFAAVAVAAALLTLAVGPRTSLLVICTVLCLVPWTFLAGGRSLPLPVFAVLAVGPSVPLVVLEGVGSITFLGIAAVALVASRTGDLLLIGGTALVTAAVPFLPWLLGTGHVGEGADGAQYFAFGTAFGALAGILLRRATLLTAELRRADDRLAAAAAREDRLRVARDVHDLVAHSLTVVVLHVAGARRVLRADPDLADAALQDAERVCRESLDGIRGVVGLLRDTDVDQRQLSLDLDDLAASYSGAGLPVALSVAGDPVGLPLVVRVLLHRVLQEALANAGRHGGVSSATTAEVVVADDSVDAVVTNERAGRSASQPLRSGGGYGLLGLRERVESQGGELLSGPVGDRWVVRCRIPVDRAALHAAPAPEGGRT